MSGFLMARPIHTAPLSSDALASGISHEGTVLAERYRVIESIENTTSCALYRGEHVRLGRPVTIKFLAESMAKSEEARAQFQRVADTMSNLRHPHVVEILEFDSTPSGVPYFVFEGVGSQRLDRWLLEQPRRTQREVGDLIGQIGSALIAAHEAGIVHGALSPSSIAVITLETGPFLKLGEFGYAGPRTGSDLAEVPDEWDVRYLAPEQAHHPEVPPTPYADQYQLAALAFEMLAGHGLFPTARTKSELIEQIIETPSPSLRRSCPGTSAVLEATLARALSKAPELRFPSLAEFVTTLRRALGSLGENTGMGQSGRQRLEAYRRERGAAAAHAPTIRGQFERAPVSAVRRTVGRYSTSDLALELDGDLARARAARLKGQVSLALGYLRDVVERSRSDGGRAGEAALNEAETQLKLLVAQFVMGEGVRLRREGEFSVREAGLRTENAQLLSAVTREMTVEEIIGASPLSSSETWCCLATLLCRGALKLAN